MTVCSGPSGSGKSSLAMDTLYAEGQRRYVESLSSYARQFLSPLQKPKVERVSGLSPAISIEQKTTSKSPRSTVGTVTEIHDYLRILFARLGQMHCPDLRDARRHADLRRDRREDPPPPGGDPALHHGPRRPQGGGRLRHRSGTNCGAPASPGSGSTASRTAWTSRRRSNRRETHRVEVVVDRAVVRRSTRSRLADAVEAALDLGRGVIHVAKSSARRPTRPDGRSAASASTAPATAAAGSFEELTPHHFSFNSPIGWCPSCEGLGVQHGADPAALVPDGRKSLRDGAVAAWPTLRREPRLRPDHRGRGEAGSASTWTRHSTSWRPATAGCSSTGPAPPGTRSPAAGRPRVQGSSTRGCSRRWRRPAASRTSTGRSSGGWSTRRPARPAWAAGSGTCRRPRGSTEFTIDQICNWPLGRTLDFFRSLKLSKDERHIAGDLLREIRDRLTLPGRRRPRLPLARPVGPDALGRRDRSGSGWPARSAAG